jgi:hypothetical protein
MIEYELSGGKHKGRKEKSNADVSIKSDVE